MSASFVSALEYAQEFNTTKLRDLDALEEFFWLLEQSVPVFHTVVAEIRGETTIEQWKKAMNAVQKRYPLLSASIRKVPGERPFFEKTPGVSIPVRIDPLTNSMALEEAMEEELQKPFGASGGPLTRATLYHARDRAVVLFATHHASLDGKSHLLLVQDLLAAVAGEHPGDPLDVLPGLGQLLGLPGPPGYAKKLSEGPVAPEDDAGVDVFQVRVQRLQLTEEETAVLLWRARKEKTTVHAALVAALALAGQRYSDAWEVGPVRCLSPIDMRKALGIPDAAGLLISLHQGIVPTPDRGSFWDIARAVRDDMLPAQTPDAARQVLCAVASSLAEEHNARDLYSSVLNGPMLHELLLTNYAGYRVRSEYGDLTLENLFTGSASAMPDRQKVSVLTVNGRLGMTLVSRNVFPTLLEDARDILTQP